MCICRNYMLILNSRSSTTLNGGLSLSSWMVQLRLSLLLLGLLKGLCSSTPSLERLIGNSLIFLLGSFIVQFKVFIDFHCHKDRRLRSLTSRAPADQKKQPSGIHCTVQSIYRLSRSLRLATAISDVARACRSKKKEWLIGTPLLGCVVDRYFFSL